MEAQLSLSLSQLSQVSQLSSPRSGRLSSLSSLGGDGRERGPLSAAARTGRLLLAAAARGGHIRWLGLTVGSKTGSLVGFRFFYSIFADGHLAAYGNSDLHRRGIGGGLIARLCKSVLTVCQNAISSGG